MNRLLGRVLLFAFTLFALPSCASAAPYGSGSYQSGVYGGASTPTPSSTVSPASPTATPAPTTVPSDTSTPTATPTSSGLSDTGADFKSLIAGVLLLLGAGIAFWLLSRRTDPDDTRRP